MHAVTSLKNTFPTKTAPSMQDILHHGHRRAVGQLGAQAIAEKLKCGDQENRLSRERIHTTIQLAHSLLDGGRISEDEHLFHASILIEDLHTNRWHQDEYPELKDISDAMNSIKSDYGLDENSEWNLSEAPLQFLALSKQYSEALDLRFAETLEEFGLNDYADLWRQNRLQYDSKRERARRAIFDPGNAQQAVLASIDVYENEARLCASIGAFYAACVMLGSASEARLLWICLNSPDEVKLALQGIPSKERPRNEDPLHWNLEHLVLVSHHAGWIDDLENDDLIINVAAWLSSLRDTRNLLHPGRHARDRPHIVISIEEYRDCLYAYQALCNGVERLQISRHISKSKTI
jgi:hypothetical protein